MSLRTRLTEIYDRLLARYGVQHWWPGDTRFEIMVGAILTQATAWTNVEKAISTLVTAGALSPQVIRALDERKLAQLIYPSGYFNAKARKLKALVEFLGERFGDDLDSFPIQNSGALREELLAVYGIGEETADDILLYALDQTTFVVDNYTKRVFHRLGLAPENEPYSAYRSLFMDHLPADLEMYREYHALIVRHGRETCRKTPVCEACCLLDLCPTGRQIVQGR